jgi:hypothetical protein
MMVRSVFRQEWVMRMSEPARHFYVENARLMAYGLSNIGKERTSFEISGEEQLAELTGKLIGAGFHSERERFTEELSKYAQDTNPFVRRCAYMGLSFSGLMESSTGKTDVLERGFTDPDREVRKTALIGFGLANIGNPNQNIAQLLDQFLDDEEWKIRGAAGLGYSFLSAGNPTHFSRFVDILQNEKSPYVKVCSCWYVSNAFAGSQEGTPEYRSLLARNGDDNSFFRDMACLGLGLSFLGTSDTGINELLETRIRDDPHPYVRESALFGLSLCNFQHPTSDVMKLMGEGIFDNSMIVRSGAALGHGITSMRTGTLAVNLHEYVDPSVLWGLTISEGLAGTTPSRTVFDDDYVQWGHEISNGFRESVSPGQESQHADVKAFQKGINAGLIGSGIEDADEKDAVRLIVPGTYHYLNYDSFWWGPWVLTALGTALRRENKKGTKNAQ